MKSAIHSFLGPAVTGMVCLCFTVSGRSQTSSADTFDAQRAQVLALGNLTAAPKTMDAPGYEPEGALKAIYFDALPWKGKPTRVFAWLGLPANRAGKVPGVVLVHGGGGTAFKEWVTRWNDRGFAAISIAVEGQTDQKDPGSKDGVIPTGWKQHERAGPWRKGIYQDSGEPLEDQWMYHAVADTILANSLLRALPDVDADRVGLMGTSWGGVITSTVIGIDTRFAFAIPVYGCGHLFDAGNQYGRSLGNNPVYRKVWDPVLRLGNAKMPVLWFSWPRDSHFPLDCQAACYAAAPGPRMVSLVPGMGHGHGPPWNRPEGYAFAEAVVRTGKPWCRQTDSKVASGKCHVTFESLKPFDRAVLVSTVDGGITGKRNWVETPAELSREGEAWVATAERPPGTTAWFINMVSGELITSSGYMEAGVESSAPPRPAQEAESEPADKGLHRMYGNMDVDKNHRVTRNEFTGLWQRNFKRMDKNGDRMLSPEEMVRTSLTAADANEDGKVSAEEDHAMRLRHFKSLDRDADGSLTLREMLRE
jgi:dienelactone hydrolase